MSGIDIRFSQTSNYCVKSCRTDRYIKNVTNDTKIHTRTYKRTNMKGEKKKKEEKNQSRDLHKIGFEKFISSKKEEHLSPATTATQTGAKNISRSNKMQMKAFVRFQIGHQPKLIQKIETSKARPGERE